MNKFRVARRACTVRGDKTRGTVSFSLVTECGATAGWRRIAIGKGLRAKEDTHASSAANASRRTCDTRREQEREKKKKVHSALKVAARQLRKPCLEQPGDT